MTLRVLLLSLFLSGFAYAKPNAEDLNWKSIFIAGDHSIQNFDQARIDLADLFSSYGALEEDQTHLSAKTKYFRTRGIEKKYSQ